MEDSSEVREHAASSMSTAVSEEAKSSTKLCKHWQRRGECKFGDSCVFAHPESEKGVGAGSSANGSGQSRKKQRRRHGRQPKETKFRRWMLSTFGKECLRGGSGVLDVAGGKGDLSVQLVNLNLIPTTVIDPRPLCAQRGLDRLIGGFHHLNDAMIEWNDLKNPPATAADVVLPDHIRLFFDNALLSYLFPEKPFRIGKEVIVRGEHCDDVAQDANKFLSTMEHVINSVAWTTKGLVMEEDASRSSDPRGDKLAGQARTDARSSVTSCEGDGDARDTTERWDAVRAVIMNCSVIIGLHPDQALDYIVDFALAAKKPFAVVPCCTYSKEFPKRRTPDGRVVRSYEELIAYIQSKHRAIQTSTLPFDGKNIVLYMTAEHFEEASE